MTTDQEAEWNPDYSPWRHGGWYTDARYPLPTPKELATVLAALRHWQDLEKRDPQAGKFISGTDREGTFFEHHDPLTVEEIDALCERLNSSPAA